MFKDRPGVLLLPPAFPLAFRRLRLVRGCALAAVAAAFLALGVALGGASAHAQTRMRIATEAASPPYVYLNAAGEPVGFDVEMARALCARVGFECSFVVREFESLLPGLAAGAFDAVVSALRPTHDRRQKVAFTRPYYRVPAAFAVRRDASFADLSVDGARGLTVGVEAHSPHARYLEAAYEPAGIAVRVFANDLEAVLDLASGRVDAVLAERPFLDKWLAAAPEGSCCRLFGEVEMVFKERGFGEGFAIALRKDDTALRQTLNDALAEMRRDGTLARLAAEHLAPPPPPAPPK